MWCVLIDRDDDSIVWIDENAVLEFDSVQKMRAYAAAWASLNYGETSVTTGELANAQAKDLIGLLTLAQASELPTRRIPLVGVTGQQLLAAE
jgi:hypothetical protein